MAVMQQLPDLSCLIQQLNPAHLFCSSTNLSLAVFFFFLLFDKTAALLRAYEFVALFQKNGATDRALFIGRPLPYHEIALRVADTAIVFSALLCLFQDDILATLGACYADFFVIRFGIATFRKARTCQESAVRSVFDDHAPSAQLANLI